MRTSGEDEDVEEREERLMGRSVVQAHQSTGEV